MEGAVKLHQHVCVWIDHREARVFGIGLETVDEEHIVEAGPLHHIHRKADQVGKGKAEPDQAFLGLVADTLGEARAILIVGPGQARHEFAAYLDQHHPAIAQRVWASKSMDHPTDREIVATARQFFRAADRMHA